MTIKTYKFQESDYFQMAAEKFGEDIALDLISIFDKAYPNAKKGQRKISVPLKSTFTFKAFTRLINGENHEKR